MIFDQKKGTNELSSLKEVVCVCVLGWWTDDNDDFCPKPTKALEKHTTNNLNS